jgi:outer membrane murein-binding lipoprotein Lpp
VLQAAAVLAALLLIAGCGDTAAQIASPHQPSALSSGAPPPSNEKVLTKRQSKRLVNFAVALRACLMATGVEIRPPNITQKKIDLSYSTLSSRAAFLQLVLRCGDRLGGPPAKSSLQTFASEIAIYVPKQCLLDARVTHHLPGQRT